MSEIEQAGAIELLRLLNYDYDLPGDFVIQQIVIRDALKKLNQDLPGESLIVQFRYIHDYSQDEIARFLDINQATVSRKLNKGIEELNKLLEEEV